MADDSVTQLFCEHRAFGQEAQLFHRDGLSSTKLAMLYLIQSRAARSLMYVETHTAQGNLRLTLAKHAIKTHMLVSCSRLLSAFPW
jgi:hypothetical protein